MDITITYGNITITKVTQIRAYLDIIIFKGTKIVDGKELPNHEVGIPASEVELDVSCFIQ